MPKPRHLRNAPITEAIVDVAVKLAPEVGLQTLEGIHEDIREGRCRKDCRFWFGQAGGTDESDEDRDDGGNRKLHVPGASSRR